MVEINEIVTTITQIGINMGGSNIDIGDIFLRKYTSCTFQIEVVGHYALSPTIGSTTLFSGQ